MAEARTRFERRPGVARDGVFTHASAGLARRYCARPPAAMSTTQDLVLALKAELRTAGLTYADLAAALGMSESSVKRVFAKADMPLSRIDEILRVLKMDFAELARKVVDTQPLAHELTEKQEAA